MCQVFFVVHLSRPNELCYIMSSRYPTFTSECVNTSGGSRGCCALEEGPSPLSARKQHFFNSSRTNPIPTLPPPLSFLFFSLPFSLPHTSVSLKNSAGVWWEPLKLLKGGPGQSPCSKRIFTHFVLSKRISWQHFQSSTRCK